MEPEVHPDVTVIVPTYNDSEIHIRRALKSILEQRLAPAEIIVVDDGSKNHTAKDAVHSLQGLYTTKIRLYHKVNGGPSSARNYGLRRCKTKYVSFLDSDDEMLPGDIERKVKNLQGLADDYCGVYGTFIRHPGQEPYPYGDFDGNFFSDQIERPYGVPGVLACYLFRTQHLLSIGAFDEQLIRYEDQDLVGRLLLSGYKIKGSIGPSYIRYYREGSLTRSGHDFEAYKDAIHFLAKAEEHQYLSKNEVGRRRKKIELNHGVALFKKGRFRQSLFHMNHAFDFAPPSTFIQHLLWITSKVFRTII